MLPGTKVVGTIRGCYESLLRSGFNTTIARWNRWLQRDSCKDYDKYEVLKVRPPPSLKSKENLTICTCYGNMCNDM